MIFQSFIFNILTTIIISFNHAFLGSEVHYFNESSGVVTSPDYGSSYPTKPDTSLIDVSAGSGENVDLLLTINELDIKGINGDYLKIGQGNVISF